MRHKSSAEKTEILERHKRSGLSLQKFAAQEGIALSTIERWSFKARKAAQARKEPDNLVEVPNVFAAARAAASYRLHFPAGYVLEVVPGFRVAELRCVIQAVQSL